MNREHIRVGDSHNPSVIILLFNQALQRSNASWHISSEQYKEEVHDHYAGRLRSIKGVVHEEVGTFAARLWIDDQHYTDKETITLKAIATLTDTDE